jgi:Protein of unknown function, DUF481
MKRIIFFLTLFLIASRVFSQSLKDTLFLTNGSILIGEIKKIKLGVMTFDPDDANDITVQLRKLKTFVAVSTVFRIQTIGSRVYFGQLVAHSMDHFVRLVGSDTAMLHVENITDLYPYNNSFIQRFSGSVGLGFTYTRSSDFGQLNFNGKLKYVSRNDEISLSTSGIYSITDSSFVRDREDLTLLYNHYFSSTWFATTFLSYQRNLQLGLNRRFQEGFGMGNKFLTTKQVYAWARSGVVFNQEKNTENVASGTLTEIFGQLQFNFFRFTKPEINFIMTQSFYYSLSQSGRFRNDGETDLSWELIDDLKLDFTFYNNYDSQPALAESRKFDFGVIFGVSYSF